MVTAPTLSEVLSASELEAYAQPAVESGEGVYGAFETPNEERQRARFERGFVREAVLVREALDRALAQTLLAAVCACWRRDGVPPTRTGVTNFVRGVPVGEETVATSAPKEPEELELSSSGSKLEPEAPKKFEEKFKPLLVTAIMPYCDLEVGGRGLISNIDAVGRSTF